jgi:hypothetical protein
MLRSLGLAAITAALCVGSSAQAYVYTFTADMSGPNESPPNASSGTGSATIVYDDQAHTMSIAASFTGLTGTTTAAHIHAPTVNPFLLTAGVATQTPSFATFPLGVTSGTHNQTLDLTLNSSWNPTYINNNGGTPASAEVAFFNAVTTGRSYYNIHTSFVGSGEIRGFLVPEPTSVALLGGAAGVMAMRRRRRVK